MCGAGSPLHGDSTEFGVEDGARRLRELKNAISAGLFGYLIFTGQAVYEREVKGCASHRGTKTIFRHKQLYGKDVGLLLFCRFPYDTSSIEHQNPVTPSRTYSGLCSRK